MFYFSRIKETENKQVILIEAVVVKGHKCATLNATVVASIANRRNVGLIFSFFRSSNEAK